MNISPIALGVLLLTFALPVDSKAVTTIIASGTNWKVSDSKGIAIGLAQNVCLNQSAPINCPAGATRYGYPFVAWTADLSSIPGATWIWAPKITGASTGAANARFTFQTQYYLCCDAQSGTFSVAADNSAEVFFDGVSVGTSVSPNTLITMNVPSASLAKGYHIIKVEAKNAGNPSDCVSDEYRCNPAGMVFGAKIVDARESLPTCTKAHGTMVSVGGLDEVPCTVDGKTGVQSRLCACITCTYAEWVDVGDCQIPPPQLPPQLPPQSPPPLTCTGSDGVTAFLPGASESVLCGLCEGIFKGRTCQSDGTWTPFSPCILPVGSVGGPCGSKSQGECKTCPAGTTCQPIRRRVCDGWLFFSHCDYVQTTDYFCLPD
jgi:hypothetical protein